MTNSEFYKTKGLYQISYKPYINIEISQSKNSDLSFNTTMLVNQDESNIDLFKYGKRLNRLADMLGNKEETKDVQVDKVSDLLNLGDRIEDNLTSNK